MKHKFLENTHRWLVTGCAGFIGSNLVKELLANNQEVVGIDDFSTGKRENLEEIFLSLGKEKEKFSLIEGSIESASLVNKAVAGVDFVLHHAALASVPYSIQDPLKVHSVNVNGFVNLLEASRNNKVKRIVYASSSAVYGDESSSPAVENRVGWLLSPYALSKKINEEYAQTYERCYGLTSVGLRYFNVYGPHQDPYGAYAAVIPLWVRAVLKEEPIQIFGDGQTTRDFCFIQDVVQANLCAVSAPMSEHRQRVFNVAASHKTSLIELYDVICSVLKEKIPAIKLHKPVYRDFRSGDVRHSMADIHLARQFLGYEPSVTLRKGILQSLDWYQTHLK